MRSLGRNQSEGSGADDGFLGGRVMITMVKWVPTPPKMLKGAVPTQEEIQNLLNIETNLTVKGTKMHGAKTIVHLEWKGEILDHFISRSSNGEVEGLMSSLNS